MFGKKKLGKELSLSRPSTRCLGYPKIQTLLGMIEVQGRNIYTIANTSFFVYSIKHSNILFRR